VKISWTGYNEIPSSSQVEVIYGWLGATLMVGELTINKPEGSIDVRIPSNIQFHELFQQSAEINK
jgi:hypothetical protein